MAANGFGSTQWLQSAKEAKQNLFQKHPGQTVTEWKNGSTQTS